MSQIFLTDMCAIWKIMIDPNTGKIDEAIYQIKMVLLPPKKERTTLLLFICKEKGDRLLKGNNC